MEAAARIDNASGAAQGGDVFRRIMEITDELRRLTESCGVPVTVATYLDSRFGEDAAADAVIGSGEGCPPYIYRCYYGREDGELTFNCCSLRLEEARLGGWPAGRTPPKKKRRSR